MSSLKQLIGCWLYEGWRTALVLRFPMAAKWIGLSWIDLCNRNETLRPDAVSGGRICTWCNSSRLTVARIFPITGRRLLDHVLQRWPISLDLCSPQFNAGQGKPDISILIPVGGRERLAQFDLTLRAACAQLDVALEILVVEQGPHSELEGILPAGVAHLFQQTAPQQPFNKSAALNLAAKAARGGNLLILDADYLLPQRFASECVRVLKEVEATRPARWIFYIDRRSSERLVGSRSCADISGIEAIVANNPTPIAVRREIYWAIGGHDESYVGWGGEDSEFLDRLRTRSVSEGGWMPVLHVWHKAAPKKADGNRNRVHHEAKMAAPPAKRIERLVGESAA